MHIYIYIYIYTHIVGRSPWTGDQSVARLLPAYRTREKQSKHTETFMPRVGFKHTTLVIVRKKEARALKGTAMVIDGNRLRAYIHTHSMA
jgi:hypothetical protein